MITISDVTVGKPYVKDGLIWIPLAHTSSNDDSDSDLPEMGYGWLHLFLTPITVVRGRQKEVMFEYLDSIRCDYATASFEKLKAALGTFFDTTDLTPLSADWMPEPASPTLH